MVSYHTKMRSTIAVSEIKVPDRIRKKVEDIDSLADSIKHLGLLQPIGLTEDRTLVWGFRRLAAVKQLGMTHIDWVSAREAPEDEREEMEYAENVERSDFTWQEKALGLLRIWRKKRLRGAAEGWKWGDREASREFQMSVGTVQYVLRVAKKLEEEATLPIGKRKYWSFQSPYEAYRLGILGEEMDKLNADLAKVAKAKATTDAHAAEEKKLVQEVTRVESSPEALDEERERYERNPLNTIPFDTYWTERKQAAEEVKNTVYLSNRLLHVDCIDYMMLPENEGAFDHIVTDPPYAIDMVNLNQQNQNAGMMDLDRVIDAHQVEENIQLFERFFPAAFKCTRKHAFVILCGDIMQWQYMYDLAIQAGFAVQRWPLIWRKVNQAVMNNCSGYNTTKDYEIVMICRKPGATLAQKRNSSIVDGSNSEVTKLFGHPFGKPFELTQVLLELCSIPGQVILEPFAGAGSMVVQIIRQNRQVIACEKDDRWYAQMLQNVQNWYLKLNPKFKFK
jgi:ParB family transcriptional regulator, chromosome partitioning protein